VWFPTCERLWLPIGFGRFAADQLVEVALLPGSRGLLKQEREIVSVEILEPLVPADMFQRTLP
jgi:hypothetical protein